MVEEKVRAIEAQIKALNVDEMVDSIETRLDPKYDKLKQQMRDMKSR